MWELELTMEDYQDMERKRIKKYPECERCKGRYVKTQGSDQTHCILCQRILENLLKSGIILTI